MNTGASTAPILSTYTMLIPLHYRSLYKQPSHQPKTENESTSTGTGKPQTKTANETGTKRRVLKTERKNQKTQPAIRAIKTAAARERNQLPLCVVPVKLNWRPPLVRLVGMRPKRQTHSRPTKTVATLPSETHAHK